ncbi:hypothetical protein [Chitinophaga barathri]|uniref:Uncharacterized protein n=1 Tax=Chitinophaga barathri TaxID=1647451 RepID=A0A3N4MBR1_9BACT|nr:hypothetical protein [Chitinophaga barathri]RPD40928.1 hypothetical protein EG028_13005 [Chitinophaga barathri]
MTSFYDLDYLIELNEKRLEQYASAYQKYLERFTVLLVIYSAFAIFLVPIIEAIYFSDVGCYWLHSLSFYVFVFLVGYSLFYTVRLLIPTDVRHLLEPRDYYLTQREKYEAINEDQSQTDSFLKAAYIYELQIAVNINRLNLERKTLFYRKAFSLGAFAIIPYVVCLGFHLGTKKDDIQKVEIVNKFSNFIKTP